jgi:hypothetical protein
LNIKKLLDKLKNNDGYSMLVPVCIMFTGLVVVCAVLLIMATKGSASAAKDIVITAGTNAVQAEYEEQFLSKQDGYSDAEITGNDVLTQLVDMGFVKSGSSAVMKNSDGSELYEIGGISVSTVTEDSASATVYAEKIQFTFTKPIYFGGKKLAPVSDTITVYVHPTQLF